MRNFGRRQRSPPRRIVTGHASSRQVASDGTLSSRPNRGGPSAMDIDSVGHNGGNNSGRGRGGRVGRGQRRGGSRGGGRGSTRGSGRRGNARKPLTQDALDNDLDNYMMKDPEVAKARLDQEMDAYQQARQ